MRSDTTPAATLEVSGLMLRALGDIVMKCGVSPDTLFQREAKKFSTREPVDVRVSQPVFRALLARAISLTCEPALGLRCALEASESAFDLLAPLVAHARTLRHALQETRQFQSLAFDGAQVQLSERAGVAILRCDVPRANDGTDRSVAEFQTAGLLRMLRTFGCGRSELYAARFDYKRPDYHHVYTEAFDGKERFGEPFTGLEFASDLLDRPNLHANPALQTVVHSLAEQRLGRLDRPIDLIARLRIYLQSQAAAAVPDMAIAARKLGLSVRTLRRRLSEAGLSYRGLTQEMQGERACTILRNPDFTVQGAADALGFANTAAFHRAFMRWTGTTAVQYRNATARRTTGRSSKPMAETHRHAAPSMTGEARESEKGTVDGDR